MLAKRNWKKLVFALGMAAALAAQTQAPKAPTGYTDTPFIPGSKWRVHDEARPRPPVITPGTSSSPETPGKPPSDAVVLFDGASLAGWRTEKGDAKWKVENGYAEVVKGSGNIITREEFGDSQLHVEWRAPSPPKGNSQGRSNSGVFLFGLYEIQVLDSFDNVTYADGQATGVYGQTPPLVNASRPPGEWQVYDIVFTAPHFKNGSLDVPAYVTVFHNSVVTQNHTAIMGTTNHKIIPGFVEHGPKGPIMLQDHGDPIRYRNIWIRPLGEVK